MCLSLFLNGDMSDFNDAYQSVINARKLIKNDEWD